jgi:enoyl-CoA hydratase
LIGDRGLINAAVPFKLLEPEVKRAARQLASLPLLQLAAMKLIVDQAFGFRRPV